MKFGVLYLYTKDHSLKGNFKSKNFINYMKIRTTYSAFVTNYKLYASTQYLQLIDFQTPLLQTEPLQTQGVSGAILNINCRKMTSGSPPTWLLDMG
jgi:hypothetical protein